MMKMLILIICATGLLAGCKCEDIYRSAYERPSPFCWGNYNSSEPESCRPCGRVYRAYVCYPVRAETVYVRVYKGPISGCR